MRVNVTLLSEISYNCANLKLKHMKKFLLAAGICLSAVTFSFANASYTLDEAAVDEMFTQSEDVTVQLFSSAADVSQFNFAGVAAPQETVGGFIIRAFFCGIIGLHRSYVGAEDIWWKYLVMSIIGIGGIVTCVDMIIAIVSGLDTFQGNDSWIAWL